MVHLRLKKGLDIPIKGKPTGSALPLVPGGEAAAMSNPPCLALDLRPFDDIRLKILVKPGESVVTGQPLAEDKTTPGRMFASPAAGTIREVRRGAKRIPYDIIIDTLNEEQHCRHTPLKADTASPEEIISRLKVGGLFGHIRSRPFNFLANPEKPPKSIFVKAVESAPFMPPAELQVKGHENAFQSGLSALAKLTKGPVHLVYHSNCSLEAFTNALHVKKHTIEGPHPAGNSSVHIAHIDPINSAEDIIWTLNAHDVVSIGYLLEEGLYHCERIISIAGPAVLSNKIGFFKVRRGFPVEALMAGRVGHSPVRLISGDPLTGRQVDCHDFLGYDDFVFCAIAENAEREFLHFMGLGLNKYTASRAYLSGHLKKQNREYAFSTSQHGEKRSFIDGSLYDKVMPFELSTIHLIKAVMAGDYDSAERYGLLEVAPEDFALASFVCPSKIEMTEIIKHGLKAYAKEAGIRS